MKKKKMVGKKVSKKKGNDYSDLVVGIIVILLVLGVFWYFNSEMNIGFSPGMSGTGQGDGGNDGDGRDEWNKGKSDILTSEERKIFDKINEIRENNGRTPLTLNPTLVASANDWTYTMKKNNKFKHSKKYSKLYYEIISMADSASDNVESWKDSKVHLEIILNEGLNEIGVSRINPFATAHLI